MGLARIIVLVCFVHMKHYNNYVAYGSPPPKGYYMVPNITMDTMERANEVESPDNNFIATIKDKINFENFSNLPSSGGFESISGFFEGNKEQEAVENKKKRSPENSFVDNIKDKFNVDNLSNLPSSGGFESLSGFFEGNKEQANGAAVENKEKRSPENSFVDNIKDKFNVDNLSNLPSSGGFESLSGFFEGNKEQANGAAVENKEKRSPENSFVDNIKDKFNVDNLSNLPSSGGFESLSGFFEGNKEQANGAAVENKEKRSPENSFVDNIKDKFNVDNLSNLPSSGGFESLSGFFEGNKEQANGAAVENKEKRSPENSFVDNIKDKFNVDNLSNLPSSGGFESLSGFFEGNKEQANGAAVENKEKRSPENSFVDNIKDKFNVDNLSNLPSSGGFESLSGFFEGNKEQANGAAVENKEKRSPENSFVDNIKDKFNVDNLSNLPSSGGFESLSGFFEGNKEQANGAAVENKEKRSPENSFVDNIKDKFNVDNLSNLPSSGGFESLSGFFEGNKEQANGAAVENKEKRSPENSFVDNIKDKFNVDNLSNLPSSGGFESLSGFFEGNKEQANGAAVENKEKRSPENSFVDNIKDKFNVDNLSNLPSSGGFESLSGFFEGNKEQANGAAVENKEKRSPENSFVDNIKDKFNVDNLSNLPSSGGFESLSGFFEGNKEQANGAAVENKEKRSPENSFVDNIKDKFNVDNLSNLPSSGGFESLSGFFEGNKEQANGAAVENKEKRSPENSFVDNIKDKFNVDNLSNLPSSGGFESLSGFFEGNKEPANGAAVENKEKRSPENSFVDNIKDKFSVDNLSNLPSSGGFESLSGFFEGNKEQANGAAVENKEKRSPENSFVDNIKDKFNVDNLSNLPSSGGFESLSGFFEGNKEQANGAAVENKEER